ncbi:PAS domain S-box-containing protein [Loktanella atrilutea]|uniref:Nif-specific regulatory protein n=1 Tax=Loktanella atrilutea TaxID=366533 RepID=A0A1M4XNZ8_LOKAT|nr:sigma 54-interacting transcriptional regulator [Loktanella atrilutea]SHE94993.1 PAS domain S-box-containing protein [Loktanella atrilutea]
MQDRPPSFDSHLAGAFGPTLLIDLDTDRILAASPDAVRLFSDETLVGSRLSTRIAQDFTQLVVFIDEVFHRAEAWTRLVAFRTAQVQMLRCELRGRAMTHVGPHVVLLNIIDLDALDHRTERAEAARMHGGGLLEWQRAQAFFSELERQNQLILNAAGEGIYGVNADGKTTFVNRAAQEMLGWTTEDLLGRDIHNMIHHHHLSGEVYPSQHCPIYRSFRFEQVNRIEDEVFWRKDGKPIRVEYVSTPIYEGQVLVGAVVIFRDITERWENERKLRDAMEEVGALRDRLMQENAYLQEAINLERAHHDIIGHSSSVRQVIGQIDLVARTDTNVLITGENGTGKSLVASAVHNESPRSRRPMIHFKGGAVPPDAIESELFGHIRGAFTGALRDRPGKLELAHGGTLFIDELCDIPLDQQGKLLAVLQRRSVARLGEDRERALDLRIIAATARNLDREVQAGRLRQDLVLFLNVFPIHCTPLRDRPEDIPPLVAHLLKLACKRLGRRVPVVTEGIMAQLQRYDWPGNVRELANVIERSAIVSHGDKLVVDIRTPTQPSIRGTTALLTDAEIDQIRIANTIACLKETGGRVSGPDGAAAMLGLQPTTLYSRIRSLGLTALD